MDEIWTVIKVNKRTTWEISDQGNVKKNGKLVIFDDSIEGYYKICLGNVHRLVAITYVPNPDNKPEIDHINGNSHDNRACNLRWVTHSENMRNPITRDRRSKSMSGKEPWNKGLVGAQEAWNKGKHSASALERDEHGRFKKKNK